MAAIKQPHWVAVHAGVVGHAHNVLTLDPVPGEFGPREAVDAERISISYTHGDIPTRSGPMILRQFLHTKPVIAASYLVGCGGKSSCAVVDPLEDVAPYLRSAEAFGMSIHYVIDTHAHADHISGGRKLAEETGATYVLHASANGSFDHLAACDEDVIELGNVTAKVLHTPGHTPEHISLLVTDTTRGPDPWFVCTGHTLMVGDMGRTELASSVEEGARALLESAQRLKSLPDYVEVLPGAFSGSVCGRSLSGKAMSTIGFERLFNDAFSMEDEEAFVRLMQADIPDAPADARTIRATNLGLSEPNA